MELRAQTAELKGVEWTHGFSAELCPNMDFLTCGIDIVSGLSSLV